MIGAQENEYPVSFVEKLLLKCADLNPGLTVCSGNLCSVPPATSHGADGLWRDRGRKQRISQMNINNKFDTCT